jgi:hypothetical protein
MTSFFLNITKSPNKNSINPCPISPNITPNKNGNVIVVKKLGFAYL